MRVRFQAGNELLIFVCDFYPLFGENELTFFSDSGGWDLVCHQKHRQNQLCSPSRNTNPFNESKFGAYLEG